MSKPTKEQEKEIRDVLKKYLTRYERLGGMDGIITRVLAGFCLPGVPAAIATDLVFSGGTMTTAGIIGSVVLSFGGLTGATGLWINGKPFENYNYAGQVFKAPEIVARVLDKMDDKVCDAFAKVSKKKISYEDFRKITDEVESDVKKLSPVFEIVSGGRHNLRTDRFEFLLDVEEVEVKQPKIKTLTDERAEMTCAGQPPSIPAMLKII